MNAAITQMFEQIKDMGCEEAQEWMTWVEDSNAFSCSWLDNSNKDLIKEKFACYSKGCDVNICGIYARNYYSSYFSTTTATTTTTTTTTSTAPTTTTTAKRTTTRVTLKATGSAQTSSFSLIFLLFIFLFFKNK
ncbi:Oidioi.mRNA.OKI2018_I69.chr2.g5326.t1.cds [Oikopleura dioica]|uniref:Oidioi.mRNA.OKI2018_I69.chr2.g5326.t1.cds n=1 Tax=Oikopleura dioica TaxID=34765 RepID=A0ABN7T6K6_OIKDI|nr:Oidioi.mRNA.OKI2018_I69.chr2.g5326.t1.cds [Oikopleura dioica]